MKKLVALFVLLAAFLSFNNNTAFSQPQIIVNLTGGYNLPLPDLKGDFPETLGGSTADSNTYLIKQGFNFGLTGKYALGKKRNVRINLGFAYNMFSQSKDYDVSGVTGTFKNKMNIININAGVEYAFMPKGKVNPYLGLDLGAYLYSGNFETTGFTTNTTMDLKSASRFGGAIGGGLEFNLSKQVGANLGFKYHLANLIGKEYDSTGAVVNEYRLDDKEHTVGTETISAKNISYLQISAGVSFFFNQPKAKKRK